jgi:hypothetical protein
MVMRQTAFLRGCLRTSVVAAARPAVREGARAALASLREYEFVVLSGRDPDLAPETIGARLRDAILTFVAQRGGSLVNDWGPLVARWRVIPGTACHHCGSPTVNRIAVVQALATLHRRRQVCPLCQLTADAPMRSTVRLRVTDDGVVGLDGELPDAAWSASLMLISQSRATRAVLAWPSIADGSPARGLRVPYVQWPPGMTRVAVVIVHRLAVTAVLARTHRALLFANVAQLDPPAGTPRGELIEDDAVSVGASAGSISPVGALPPAGAIDE